MDPDLVYVHPLPLVGGTHSELYHLEKSMKSDMDEKFWSNVQENLTSQHFWKGQICAFRYDQQEEDQTIYRVLIEKISRKLGCFQVFSIDYGWRQICKCSVGDFFFLYFFKRIFSDRTSHPCRNQVATAKISCFDIQGEWTQTVKSNLDLTERKNVINFNLKVDSAQGRLEI